MADTVMVEPTEPVGSPARYIIELFFHRATALNLTYFTVLSPISRPTISLRTKICPATRNHRGMDTSRLLNSCAALPEYLNADGKSLHSFTISPLITIIVGKRRKEYKLHRAQLMSKSPFFEACLSAGMVEQQKNEIVLPEDSCRGFDIVADWVYNKTDWDTATMEGSMLRAYVLADKYGMPDLQNSLIDNLGHFWTYKTCIRPARVLWLARNAMTDCPLYRLATDQLAYEIKKEGKHYGDKQDTTPASVIKTEPNAEPQPDREVGVGVDRAKELTKALAHPDLSTKLLWGAIHASRSTRPPARAAHYYRVPKEKPKKRTAKEMDS